MPLTCMNLTGNPSVEHAERMRAVAKRHSVKPADRVWLEAMSAAIRIAWTPGANNAVLQLAASVGEAGARKHLLTVLRQAAA